MISVSGAAVAADLIGGGLGRPLLRNEDRRLLFPAIAATGLALDLTVFSVLPLDLYRAGFSAFAPIVLAAVAIVVTQRAPRLACLAAIMLAAFDLQLLRSRNLFDYATDPLVVAFAMVWCVVAALRRRPRATE